MIVKYKINGIVTIPAGIAQTDELKIDSPTIELLNGSQKSNGNAGEANISLGVRFTYMQGNVEIKRLIDIPFDWNQLADAQKQIIGQMVQQSWQLLLSQPDYSEAILT